MVRLCIHAGVEIVCECMGTDLCMCVGSVGEQSGCFIHRAFKGTSVS